MTAREDAAVLRISQTGSQSSDWTRLRKAAGVDEKQWQANFDAANSHMGTLGGAVARNKIATDYEKMATQAEKEQKQSKRTPSTPKTRDRAAAGRKAALTRKMKGK
jgi:hypothetical protein